jgi:hypothetical protein
VDTLQLITELRAKLGHVPPLPVSSPDIFLLLARIHLLAGRLTIACVTTQKET